MVPVLAAALFLQAPVNDPVLLALTPVLDGQISDEEWLTLGGPGAPMGYFQWEPGVLHFAGRVPKGYDFVLSLDPAADGWLNGNDNREIRVAWVDGRAVVSGQTLETNGRIGPKWTPYRTQALKTVGAAYDDHWVIEGSLSLGRSVREGRKVGAMVSHVPSGEAVTEAFVPRPLRYFQFGFDSGHGLPEGTTWKSDTRLRIVAREDGAQMDFQLRGPTSASTGLVRAEGFARSDMAVISRPVPSPSNRGTRTIEYKSDIANQALPGWRILRATVGDAVLRTSIKIAELVEIDVDLPESVPYSVTDRSVKGRVDIRSSGVGRVEGNYDVSVDPAWTVRRGGAQRVLIYNPRGREGVNLDFLVPGGSTGEFSVTFVVTVGSQTFTKSVIIEVLPEGS